MDLHAAERSSCLRFLHHPFNRGFKGLGGLRCECEQEQGEQRESHGP
jgi:hypothetical protein